MQCGLALLDIAVSKIGLTDLVSKQSAAIRGLPWTEIRSLQTSSGLCTVQLIDDLSKTEPVGITSARVSCPSLAGLSERAYHHLLTSTLKACRSPILQ